MPPNQEMRTEAEIKAFLKDFKDKMKIWDVLFRDDRGKNAQALVDLEIPMMVAVCNCDPLIYEFIIH